MPNCIVSGCPHRSGQKDKYPNVTLHNFPNNIHKITNWLRQTSQYGEDLESVANEIFQVAKTGRHRICSVHFTEDSFIIQGSKRVLKPSAVPTIFLNQPTPISVSAIETAPFQSHKRRRVEQKLPFPSQTIVRVIKNLVTVGTQTDKTLFADGVTADAKPFGIHSACGQDNPIIQPDTLVRTGDDYVETEPWRIRSGHSYPVEFPIPIKLIKVSSTTEHMQYELIDDKSNVEEAVHLSQSLICGNQKSSSFYAPKESTLSSCTEGDRTGTVKPEEIHQRRFIVFEELLDQLLYLIKCQHSAEAPCHAPIVEIDKKIYGTMVAIKLTCLSGHCSLIWNSQPMSGEISTGNLSVACAILLSGSSFTKVQEMFKLMSMPLFPHTTYYTYKKRYIFPAIELAWTNEQESFQKHIVEQAAVLAGYGQFDSSVDSAKYCTFSMMDSVSKKIVDFAIEQVGPGKNAGTTEQIALKKCLDNLEAKGVDIKVLATNQNSSVRKFMKSKSATINHKFGVWHICKSLVKKLTAASKKRKCKDIAQWIGPITNHLIWCVQTCDQNVDLLLDKWRSLMYHIANRHTFKNLKHYTKCQHKQLTAQEQKVRKWITPAHPAYSTLVDILNNRLLIRDISRSEKFCHPGDLENFHSKVLKYRPKKTAFQMDSVYARTMLAVLSHNKNVNHPQAMVHCSKTTPLAAGNKSFQLVFPEQKKEWIPNPIYEQVTDVHLFDIISDAAEIVRGEIVHRW
ncbi:uncharacterized protein LOC108711131 isoform X2 [Xenopus laevis]|nr:uncharacterized protein LOC108711131 isoform X2 [Xenopus laevis]XP_041442328.1 uncharacterized protein LOC108711131 isoform X2 [Xenopus laevis]XP_041442329.1 uncharacterized protein LOC108711131 isoform X2 [Xenopus laevis]